jgi:hypothetical protein
MHTYLLALTGFSHGRKDAVHSFVWRYCSRLPANSLKERLVLESVNLYMEWTTALDHFLFTITAKTPSRQVTSRASTYTKLARRTAHGSGEATVASEESRKRAQLTQSHEQVLLGQKFERIPLLRGRWAHKVPPLSIQPRDLKDVEHVVDIRLGEAKRGDGAREVGVAVKVVLRARQHRVDVGVAARAQQVVRAAAVLVVAVPRQSVVNDGGEGPHVWQAGPQAVVSRDVRGVQLARAGGPEALTRVVPVPDVEVAWKKGGGQKDENDDFCLKGRK